MFAEDKRMFPEFEDKGDYVQLKSREYPNGNVQKLAQGYEGMFVEDKRMFKDIESPGDYWAGGREMHYLVIYNIESKLFK